MSIARRGGRTLITGALWIAASITWVPGSVFAAQSAAQTSSGAAPASQAVVSNAPSPTAATKDSAAASVKTGGTQPVAPAAAIKNPTASTMTGTAKSAGTTPVKGTTSPAPAPAKGIPAVASKPTDASASPPARGNTAAAKKAGSKPAKSVTTPLRSAAHFDRTYTYQYNAIGRRDPFQSLGPGQFVGVDVGGHAPPDVGNLTIVGIVWGDADRFALAEDLRGNSYVLRRGDKVMNGFVEGLRRDAVIIRVDAEDESQTVTLPLTRKGDSHANR